MNLAVAKREVFGKKTQALRRDGRIPAELYGHNVPNEHLSVDAKEFDAVFREAGESSIVYLADGTVTHPVIIHDLDIHPITEEVRSIDFYKVNMEEKITVTVPIEFTGEAPGVRAGGILVKALQEVEVECLPTHIPHEITVDLAPLDEIGKTIHIGDLPTMEGVEILQESTAVIALINEPEPEEEQAPATEVDVSAVVVESEEKRQQKEKEAGTAAAA